MLIEAREIPIDPSMVSLWVPGRDDHIRDLIKNNFGHVSGVLPNIAVQPGLISPDLGWFFDGNDDYIDLGCDKSLNVLNGTLGAWAYFEDLSESCLFSKIGTYDHGYTLATIDTGKIVAALGYGSGWEGVVASGSALSAACWNFIVVTFEQSGLNTKVKLYENNGLVKSTTMTCQVSHGEYHTQLGRWGSSYLMDGCLALPFIANTVWTPQQVNNFYLATRGLFYLGS